MLSKLKLKFIAMNMGMIVLLLCIVFSAVYITSYRRFEHRSISMLEMALERKKRDLPPPVEIGRKGEEFSPMPIPLVIIRLDGEGRVISQHEDEAKLAEEVTEEVIDAVRRSSADKGILGGWNLRYRKKELGGETEIVFADCSSEVSDLRTLRCVLILCFLLSATAFFVLNLYLADVVLQPVERAWIRQRQFAADASHELRTPLTVILTNLNILQRQEGAEETERGKWIESSRQEALRMKELIEEMLFLTQTEGYEHALPMSRTAFSELLLSSVLSFEPLAFERGLSLKYRIEEDIYVYGNESYLRRLAGILLDNACKYAAEGSEISAELAVQGSRVSFRVRNIGTPISEDDLPHIFERFYRTDRSRERKTGGYGLGLAIAKNIADLHGGSLTVRSSEKEGTSFSFCLKGI